uniref:Tonsoku-like protein n=1 Tax=Pseudonaja textilis TaxID=8673 RepID=A0A670ZBX9_PSETE
MFLPTVRLCHNTRTYFPGRSYFQGNNIYWVFFIRYGLWAGRCVEVSLPSSVSPPQHQRRHLELARTVSNAVEQQRAWATIGRTYMFMAESGQLEEALQEAEKAFMKSLAILDEELEGTLGGESEMRSRLYLNLGLIYDSLKNPAMRTSYIKKSIYISEQAHLSEDLFRAYFNLGNIHLREKEHSQAMRCLERARECAGKMKEKYMESECYASIAQVLLGLGDFVAAKRSLKKAYRLGSWQPQQRDSIGRNLPTKVSRLQEALEEAEATGDLGAALGLSEQLGDLFCKVGEYRRAAEAYEKQVRPRCPGGQSGGGMGRGEGKESRVRSIVDSLRLKFLGFGEETTESGRVFQTLTTLFLKSYFLQSSLVRLTLSLYLLCALVLLWLKLKYSLTGRTLQCMILYTMLKSDRRRRNSRFSSPFFFAQTFKLPFLFLCQEHPVNPRDYCGWTPLHEACNHGHLETVRLLLDHGASIDDPGGPGCEGITPLHDALNCGHFEVAELLIQRGASVLLRNAKGLSPLGTLQAWVQLYGKDLDLETHQQCRAMESLLRKTMAEQGEAPPRRVLSEPQAPCSLSPSPKSPGARQHQPEADEDYMAPLRPVKKKQRLLGQTLVGEARPAPPADYQAAMLGLGSAPLRLPPSPQRHKGPPRPALIPADEYVGDDWLEDDLAPGMGSRKRSRRSPAGVWGSGSEDSEGGRPARQTRLTLDRALLGRSRGAGPPPRAEPAGEPSSLLEGAGGSPTWRGDSPPSGAVQLSSPPVRVRVRVQDSVFLIPVPQSRPVAWLAKQASQRYYQTCGLLPHLTLQKEGALLAPQDSILDVLQSNEEVLAEVQSWDLPPLLERYRKACRTLAVGKQPLLERQASSSSFSASGTALGQRQLLPLLRALKLQASLRQLCLSGTGLGDDSAEELQATLGTIPGLKGLDLSANRLGPDGLQKLVVGLPGSLAFQNLEELDLSLNPLGDGSAPSLASLLQACPVLGSLRLQACRLGATFPEPHSLLLGRALKGAVHLKRLSLSHNALSSRGLGVVLESLPFESLTHLEVGSLEPRPGDRPQLRDTLVRYLRQEGCALTHLGLSGNHLDDQEVSELARSLLACPSLASLDLSANPAISILGLRTLLVTLEERKRGLQSLNLAGELLAGVFCSRLSPEPGRDFCSGV